VDEIEGLREALQTVGGQLDTGLPDCLPILGYGLLSDNILPAKHLRGAVSNEPVDSPLPLATLLARTLLAFTRDFEREAGLSLAICANILRLADHDKIAIRDLPRLSGVSKEAIAMSVKFLEKTGHAVIEADPGGSRSKILHLTPEGRAARDRYHKLVREIELRWVARYGEQTLLRLYASLERLAGLPNAPAQLLMSGMTLYPDGWRAAVPKPDTLPHQPMVLHRGGFPDGS